MKSNLSSVLRDDLSLFVAMVIACFAVAGWESNAAALSVFGVGYKSFIETTGLPSELYRFSETGAMEQRWDIPEARLGTSLATDGTSLLVGELGGAIQRFKFKGSYLGEFADVSGLAGFSPGVQRLETDAGGSIYTTFSGYSSNSRTSFRLDHNGNISQTFSHSDLVFPVGIDAAANGDVYIVNSARVGVGNRLFRFRADGAFLGDYAIPQANNPSDLAINESASELYLSDEFAHAINIYDISSGNLAYSSTIPLPGRALDVFIESTSGRIFGTYSTKEGAGTSVYREVGYEVTRNGDLTTIYVENAPPEYQSVYSIVAVIPEPPCAFLAVISAGFCWPQRRVALALLVARHHIR